MYEQLVEELKQIRNEVLASNDLLNTQQKKDFNIVLNTLTYIATEAENKDSNFIKCMTSEDPISFYPSSNMDEYAIIHFEQLKGKDKATRKEIMINALVREFIDCYKIIKEAGKNGDQKPLNEFITKMNAVCIDARTRGAFDFARKLGKAPTFSQMVGDCTHKLGDNASYFSIYNLLLNDKWGTQYSAEEKSLYEIGKKDGTLNSDKVGMIKEYMELTTAYEPDKDFLKIYPTISSKSLPQFYKFVLQHPEFLSEIKFETEEESNEFNQFMVAALLSEGRINEISSYIKKISPEKLLAFLREKIAPNKLLKLSDDKVIEFLKLANIQLAAKPSELQLFYHGIKDAKEENNSYLKELIKADRAPIIKWLFEQNLPAVSQKEVDTYIQGQIRTNAEFKWPVKLIAEMTRGDIERQMGFIKLMDDKDKKESPRNVGHASRLIFSIYKNEGNDLSLMDKVITEIPNNSRGNAIKTWLTLGLCVQLIGDNPADTNIIKLIKISPQTLTMPIDDKNNTLLFSAISSNNGQLVRDLIASGVNINQKNNLRKTPIFMAAVTSKWDAVRVLLDQKELNMTDKTKEEIFLYAVRDNQEDVAIHLLYEKGVKAKTALLPDYLSGLHYAIKNNNIRLADHILHVNNNVDFAVNIDRTPWIFSAENKNVSRETVEWILKCNWLDLLRRYNGKTAFQIANEVDHPAFKYLLNENNTALVDCVVNQVQYGHINLEQLAELSSEIYKYSRGFSKWLTALRERIPAEKFNTHLNYFLSVMADELINKNDILTLKSLIEQNPSLLNGIINDKGETLLHLAAKANKPDIVKFLQNLGAQATLKNNENKTAIEIAVDNQSWDAVMQVAKQSTDSEDKAGYGYALLKAAESDQQAVAVQLLHSGASLNHHDGFNFYAIHHAVKNRNKELLEELCKDIRTIQSNDNKQYNCVNIRASDNSNTPLHYACQLGHSDMVRVLVEQKGIDLEQKWNNLTALEYSIKTPKNKHDIIVILMKNDKPSILKVMSDKIKLNKYDFVVEILHAIYKNKGDIRGYLDEIVKISDKKNLLSFFLNPLLNLIGEELVKRNDITLIRHLHALDPTLLDISGLTGGTSLLHIAAKENAVEVINELVKLRVDITDTNSENQSMLLIAAENNAWDVLSHVKEMKEMRDFEDADKALFVLSKKLISNDEKEQNQAKNIISTLIDKGISVSFKDTQDPVKLMPVHYAVMSGDLDLVKKIFAKDPNPNARVDADSPTPLIVAMKDANTNPDIIFFLLKQKGIDLSYQFEGKTALEYAIELNPRLKRKLFGADSSDLQLEILAAQIKNGDVKSAKILLDVIGKQPKANIDEIIEKLIKAGVKEAASLQEAKPEQKPEKKPEKKQEDHYQPGPALFGKANNAAIPARQSINDPIFPEANVKKNLGS